MNSQNDICHEGIVQEVRKDSIRVKILAKSACASCHAKGMCNLSDMKEKIIEVKRQPHHQYEMHDKVIVVMSQGKGFKALFLGYILPFILLMTALVSIYATTNNEGLAGLVAVGLMIPYYFILWLRRDKIKEGFEFRVK